MTLVATYSMGLQITSAFFSPPCPDLESITASPPPSPGPVPPTHLLEHVQDELQVDLVDAHGERLPVHALAEVARAHQQDELPGVEALLPAAQLQLVVLEALLHPAAAHGLRQLPQEVLNLIGERRRRRDLQWMNLNLE